VRGLMDMATERTASPPMFILPPGGVIQSEHVDACVQRVCVCVWLWRALAFLWLMIPHTKHVR
jgi:hypothetical protein